ncbi:calcium-binding protein [Aureimonas sp. AU20]|uniref:calcium-binding protein n=1 Tax=Aureimonas sp. AU20 TaxID=1349819 RepID=UPI0007200DBF|nr:calcium-binding protein [Aureimonas sp. AU20]ALN73082.1 serralysin [Aureimonas sp. AU20]
MADRTYVTGLWRNVEAATGTANRGFQFVGLVQPDPSGRGYELTPETALAASQSVEWMRDPAMGLVHSYAQFQYDQLTAAVRAKGLAADDEAIGSDAGDRFVMAGGDDKVYARAGHDWIDGGAGNDLLFGQDGDDTIIGGAGSDRIDGGAGTDRIVLDGLDGAGFQLFRSANTVYAIDLRHGFVDTIVEAEIFAAPEQAVDLASVARFDPLTYAAGYNDLAQALRTDGEAATAHYIAHGAAEGRHRQGFDAAQYLKSYGDLKAVFGDDLAGATRHFLSHGVDEHRLPENPLVYIASFADLIAAFHGGSRETLAASGLGHYQTSGFAEGRRDAITFEAKQYLENYADLRQAFGADTEAGTAHYINRGSAEHRLASDPLLYVASSEDLTRAFGGASASHESVAAEGLQHYEAIGYREGRATQGFDVDAYLNRYADLRAAFADGQGGYDEDAALLHYIRNGFGEGRSDDWLI